MPNLYPEQFITTPTELPETQTSQVKFGRSWRFDFEAGEFVLTTTGKIAESKDEDSWIDWCQKTLLTERYRYLIYSRQYGQEFEDLIRRNLNRAGNESEIKRMVTEALKVDPRTASVDNFKFTWDGDKCFYTCTVTSVRSKTATLNGEVVTG
ncbi:MAG: hypothetical protein A4E56_00126 [Pelotomaculum sp. PtaU1.Bin065]|nr:MAG: hypothetical protein A4E56_00126 [Pelotomaculum sp. PtaU1.Bin065]